MNPDYQEVVATIETDYTGFTFVRFNDEDVPYRVLDELEANYVHARQNLPDRGDSEPFGIVVYSDEGEIIDVREK